MYIAAVKPSHSLLIIAAILCGQVHAADEQAVIVKTSSVADKAVMVHADVQGKPTEFECDTSARFCSEPQPGEYRMLPAGADESIYNDCTNVVLYKFGSDHAAKEKVGVYCWLGAGGSYINSSSALNVEPVRAVPSEVLSGSRPGSPEYCRAVEPLRPNLVLSGDTIVQGRVTDQTTAPLNNSPIELRRFISDDKQQRVKKESTDADGKFDLGKVKRGEYRLLLAPHRGFKQPEKLECLSSRCVLDTVLIVTPTDQLAGACPIR